MREVARVAELVAEGRRIEHRIGAPHGLGRPRRFARLARLRMSRGQHHVVETRLRIAAQVELRLLDGFGVALLEVVSQAEREAVEGVELGIDALRQLQRLDGGIGLAEPDQDVAAAGQRVGVTGIDRDRPIDLRCASSNWL